MSHQPKFERYLISLLKHYENGLLKVWLTPDLSQTLAGVERGCMILNRLVVVWEKTWISLHYPKIPINKSLRSFIVGFHQTNNYPILNDSKHCCRLLFQIVKSLPTLVPVSTTTNKDSPNWWKWYVGNRSEELWLPSKTDFCDLGMSSSPRCVKNIMSKSWFTLKNIMTARTPKMWRPKNSKRISCQSLTSSLPDEMGKRQECLDDLDESKKSPNSVMKVKLYPTKSQKRLLNKMFGSHRAIYNKLVESSKEDCRTLKTSEIVKKYRPISQKQSLSNYLPQYHLDVPEEVMDSTFRDYMKALKSSLALYKSLKSKDKKTSFPDLGFKSRRDNTSSIELRSRSIKTNRDTVAFFKRYFGNNGIKIKEQLPDINYSIRLQRTRERQFYLCIPRAQSFTQTTSLRACAIDPGVRSFITLYDPEGLTLSVDDTKNSIFRRCLLIDRLQSHITNEKSKRKRSRLRTRIYRLYQRVKAMVSDMHHKLSNWLSKTYKEALLPSFNTSEMTSKQKRISSKTTRAMLTWAHYKFKCLLGYKMERTGGRMIECEEHYTTKTCSCCGTLNHSITREKVFKCNKCSHECDRDVNAARNIFLKNEHLLTLDYRSRVTGDAYSKVVSSQ